MPDTRASGPRSLTQMVREWSDDEVVTLLVQRPDLAWPTPDGFSQVASRATTRESVRRALDRLDSLDLWVVTQVVDGAAPASAADIAGVPADTAGDALRRLRGLALLWGPDDALRPVRALAAELERGRISSVPDLQPPDLSGSPRQDLKRVDHAAAAAAYELVRRVTVLAEHAEHSTIPLRHDGELGSREARYLGSLLGVSPRIALLHVEVARQAGLLAALSDQRKESLLPTAVFDAWHELPTVDQWDRLRAAWMLDDPARGSESLKRLCLRAFGEPGKGLAPSPADAARWLRWQLPRQAEEAARRLTALLDSAPWIGTMALGALSTFALGEDLGALDRLLPRATDSVLVQGDLTAVAAGPLTPEAARDLGALAEVESRGGATVYRFTVGSLRNARQHGWSTARIQQTLERRSRTVIPQPLAYLVADLEREPDIGTGHAAYDGEPAPPPRAPVPAVEPAEDLSEGSPLSKEDAELIVSRLRAPGEETAADDASPDAAADAIGGTPVDALREAVETGEIVWLGYVDGTGAGTEALVRARAVRAGALEAEDSRSGTAIVVPVGRITAAHIIRGGSL